MSKTTYLYIYLVMLASFFYVVPFGYLATINRGAPFLVLELLWLVYGKYKYERRNLLYKAEYSHFNLILFLCILPSAFMAYRLFNQGVMQSLISYRNLFLFYAIPVFLKIEFSTKNVIRACSYFAVTALITGILQKLEVPWLFYFSEGMESIVMGTRMNEDEVLHIEGPEIVLIPLYFYCQKLYHKFSYKTLWWVVILFGIIFAGQNRSTLFPAAIVVGATFIFSDFKPVLLKYLIIAAIFAVAIYVLKDSFLNLIELTNTQVTSTYDPRVIAMNYFFDFDRMSLGEILFGTGNISFQTSNYVKNLQDAHIHYSDVGFVGFWSQYGILPVLLFIYFLVKGLLDKKIPAYVRVTAAHILICGVTISYFDTPIHMIWFILYFYLYKYYSFLNDRRRLIRIRRKVIPA